MQGAQAWVSAVAVPTGDQGMPAQHPFKLIVFDLDGTLVDSQYNILAAYSQAFAAEGLPAPAIDAVRRVVGLRLEEATLRLCPEADERQVLRVTERYREAFFEQRRRPDYYEPLFPGASETLATLNQPEVFLGIATGKNRRGLHAVLERHGIKKHFVTLQSADDGAGKPHPQILHQAMAEVAAEPKETVMVGDTSYDIEMAGNAGTRAVGVAWGYHPPAELISAGADCVIAGFAELLPALVAMRR